MRLYGGRFAGTGGGGRCKAGAVVPVLCKRCGRKMQSKGRETVLICAKCLKNHTR